MLPNERFNQAWEDYTITKPLIILIGGYAGTGKSTLATRFASRVSYIQTIPTGIFRSIAQTQTTPEQNPALFLSTYDLHTLHAQAEDPVLQAYKEQCAPVTNIIKSVISFLTTEKQHLIIEGNHILPWERYSQPDCHIIELYMYVEDAEKHRLMLGGPTHNRTVTDKQFATGRKIHDILCKEAIKHKKALFECSEMDKAEEYLQQEISKVIQPLVKQKEIHSVKNEL